MKNMCAIVLFLVIMVSMSSTLGNDVIQEIFMVVDDNTTMHDLDAGTWMTKANPVETGKFLLEDGKVLQLARKSSPSRNCIYPDQPCGALDWCCEGLACEYPSVWTFTGKCVPDPSCRETCNLFTPCCWPKKCGESPTGFACL